MEKEKDTLAKTAYFIAKVANIRALSTCIKTGKWACKDKMAPPHPKDILREAFSRGPVVIIFSVNNCHGYHGYAEMTMAPDQANTENVIETETGHEKESARGENEMDTMKSKNTCTGISNVECSDSENQPGHVCIHSDDCNTGTKKEIKEKIENIAEVWHYFSVKWKINFLNDFGEQCLPFTNTEGLYVKENDVENLPLNKCRNWQEVSETVGEHVCDLLERHYFDLCTKRDERQQRKLEKQPKAFYDTAKDQSTEQTWRQIVNQVEKDLGKVILTCPFGSQRYNLSTPDSDTDMFIVYQARTDDMLGFNPPKQTIKSSERETCDYTIHEVFRYCELLLSGDARCVETLFLHDSTVVYRSEDWHKLKEGRQLLLNKECLSKYLRDAQGSKGTRYLRKWCDDNKSTATLPAKMCKMLYVIVRLLQNARDIVVCDSLRVYRENGSEAREQLMSIRSGGVPVAKAWEIIDQIESEISLKADQVPDKSKELQKFLEHWLLDLRHQDLTESRESWS